MLNNLVSWNQALRHVVLC